MNLQNHLLLAVELEQYIKKKYGLALRWDMFYYGNIRPDLTPRWIKKYPHTFQGSLPMFLRQCRILMFHSRFARPPLYLLSYRLGVACHYVADFFTYAHYDPILFQQVAAHFRYESELYSTFAKGRRVNPQLPSAVGLRLDDFLLQAMKQYGGQPHSPTKDADYIYYVARLVCDRLIERIYLEKDRRTRRWLTEGRDARGQMRERLPNRRAAKKVAYEWENYWPVNMAHRPSVRAADQLPVQSAHGRGMNDGSAQPEKVRNRA